MERLKIFLSIPYEGYSEEEFKILFENEKRILKSMFRNNEIDVYPRQRGVDSRTVIEECDICAMGQGWIYIHDCEEDRRYAVSLNEPIIITDAEYTPSFIKKYIVAKALKNRVK